MSSPVIAAIDFGTSNSTIGMMHNGQPALLMPEAGHYAVPTALFYPQGKSNPLTGRAAIAAYMGNDSGRFMRGLKSVLGTQLFQESTQIGFQTVTFLHIIAGYIHWLLKVAEAHHGAPVTHLMLGRPVHFLTNQPESDALAEAQLTQVASSLGIQHLAFLPEPLAAAYHYEHTLNDEERVLIIDIGGGTADFSVLNLGPALRDNRDRSADILATHGLRLGGAMIDQAFALAEVMPSFGHGSGLVGPDGTSKGLTVPAGYYTQLTSWHRIHRMYEKATLQEVRSLLPEAVQPALVERLLTLLEERGGHRLMLDVEQAKIALSNLPQTELDLKWVETGLALPLTSQSLADAIAEWRHTLNTSIHHTLSLAGLAPAAVSTVFVTGGPSAMPLVQSTIAGALPGCRILCGDQLTSVGSGLVLAAHRHFNVS